MRHIFKSFAVAATLVGSTLSAANAGTIFFDSFEEPDVARWSVFQTVGTWSSIAGTGIEIQNGRALGVDTFHGDQYVELDSDSRKGGISSPNTNSTMLTELDFMPGQQYEISFAYRPRTNQGGDDNGIQLFAGDYDGTELVSEMILASVSETLMDQPGWTMVSVVFTAMADTNAFGFRAFGKDNSLGGFIDAVSVSAVPVPAAALLFGSGLAAFGAARRKRAATAS